MKRNVGAGLPARDGTGVNTRAAKAAPTARQEELMLGKRIYKKIDIY